MSKISSVYPNLVLFYYCQNLHFCRFSCDFEITQEDGIDMDGDQDDINDEPSANVEDDHTLMSVHLDTYLEQRYFGDKLQYAGKKYLDFCLCCANKGVKTGKCVVINGYWFMIKVMDHAQSIKNNFDLLLTIGLMSGI